MAHPRRLLALVGAALAAQPSWTGSAASGGYFGRQPSSSLPQTLRGTVQVPLAGSGDGTSRQERRPADTLRELYPTLAACWEAPPGLARLERTEITARFSLRRDGTLIGEPRITFATPPSETRARAILTEATIAAIRRCTPARITAALGGAIAGRPMALRFVYAGPRGQGV